MYSLSAYLDVHPADRGATQRDDLPLPTLPPYTAFIGNLAFDLTEPELEDLFTPLKVRAFIAVRTISYSYI